MLLLHMFLCVLVCVVWSFTAHAQPAPYAPMHTWTTGLTFPSPPLSLSPLSPAGRVMHGSSYANTNTLYIYGGLASAHPVGESVVMGDLWEYFYEPQGGTWKWIRGIRDPISYNSAVGNYSVTPGPRLNAKIWMDGSNVMLFGGLLYDAVTQSPIGQQNDLWRYDSAYFSWSCINTSSLTNPNIPSPRFGALSIYSTFTNTFYLIGGFTDSEFTVPLNEMWCYSSGAWSRCWNGTGLQVKADATVWQTYDVNYDEIWVYGGRGGISDVWRYSAGQWHFVLNCTMEPDATNPGSRFAMDFYYDYLNKIYYFSGGSSVEIYNGNRHTYIGDKAWMFDIQNYTWQQFSSETYNIISAVEIFPTKSHVSCLPQTCISFGKSQGFSDEIKLFRTTWITVREANPNNEMILFPNRPPSLSGGFLAPNLQYLYLFFGRESYNNGSNENVWRFSETQRWELVNISGQSPTPQNYPIMWSNDTHAWQFGGADSHVDDLNANMYMFEFSTNTWSNIYQETSPFYGNSVRPSGRVYAQTAQAGNYLYMYGGYGYSSSSTIPVILGDMWKYNLMTGEWEFYPILNSNYPGARYAGMACANNTHFWLYGGINSGQSSVDSFWQFTFSSSEWKLITSKALSYPQIHYSTVESSPGTRVQGSLFLINGDIFLFGGQSKDGQGVAYYNDLWMFPQSTTNIPKNWYYLSGYNFSPAFSNPPILYSMYSMGNPAGRGGFAYAVVNNSFWFYGGLGIPEQAFCCTPYGMGDLWKIDMTPLYASAATAKFEYKTGNPFFTDDIYVDTVSIPGQRRSSSLCGYNNNSNSFLFLFGGITYSIADTNTLWTNADLWSYSNTQWNLLHGFFNDKMEYVIGNKATPGMRSRAITWIYNNKIYLFGGVSDTLVQYNDLWQYDPEFDSWQLKSAYNPYPVIATSNYPGSIRDPSSYINNNGELTLFGGQAWNGTAFVTSGDTWTFTTSTNTWTFSLVGSLSNSPGPRIGALIWKLNNPDLLYVMGGIPDYGRIGMNSNLYSYSTAGGWTLVLSGGPGIFVGNTNETCTSCTPGLRIFSSTWIYNSDLYLFGGSSTVQKFGIPSQASFADVWRYSILQNGWAYMSGKSTSVPVPRELVNEPATYFDSVNAVLYIVGDADEYFSLPMSTLNFTTMTASVPKYPRYPDKKNENTVKSRPGNRRRGAIVGNYENITLVSGLHRSPNVYNYSDSSPEQWKYSQGKWKIVGSTAVNHFPSKGHVAWNLNGKNYVFGGNSETDDKELSFLFVADEGSTFYQPLGGGIGTNSILINDTNNKIWPGARTGASGWVYKGELWLFGGYGYGRRISVGTIGALSDVWKYNISLNAWTFVLGSPLVGHSDSTDLIGARYHGSLVQNGDLVYYYGGNTAFNVDTVYFSNNMNSLWEFNIDKLVWRQLSFCATGPGRRPPAVGLGGPAPNICPGSRSSPVGTYVNGSLFYYSGSTNRYLDVVYWADVWQFDLKRSMWFWIAGSERNDIYGSTFPKNSDYPIGRRVASSLQTNDGMWIYGGTTTWQPSLNTDLSDLWYIRINTQNNTAPPVTTTTSTSTISTTTSISTSTTTSISTTTGGSTIAPVDPCSINNGDCDYRVTCSSIGTLITCGPCPSGTYLNGTACISYCGDKNCSTEIGENCVTCYQDCQQVTCGICGDGECAGDETCHTCFQDCGLCAPAPCPSNCNGRGSCYQGQCTCNSPWTGPSCNIQVNVPVNVTVNATTPNIRVIGQETTFSISIQSLAEINQIGETIRYYPVSGINFTLVDTTDGMNKIHNYTAVMQNKASISIFVLELEEKETVIEFAGVTTIYKAHTIKLTINVKNWPFLSLSNSLSIVLDANPNNENSGCTNEQVDANNNLRWYTVKIGQLSLYGQFLEQAIIDERIRKIKYTLNENKSVTATLPHFWTYADMDPHFSVLLGDDTADKCKPPKGKENTTKLVAIIVPVVVLSIVGIAALAFFIPKFRARYKIWKAVRVTSELGNSMDDISFEKTNDMRIHTTAGTFEMRF